MVGGGEVDKDAAALAHELPGFNIFFDQTGLEVPAVEAEGEQVQGAAGEDDEEELEWLSNKDAFPSVETMAAVDEEEAAAAAAAAAVAAPARAAVGPRTKGLRRRRRVTAPWSLAPALPRPAPRQAAARRRCTHCASEETPQWRLGPDGPRTLCNACGVRFKTGRLLPEYRPANSPTFSPLLHSNSHRRVLEMRSRGVDGGEASPSGRAIAKARRAERVAARHAAKDGGDAPGPAQAETPALP
ncbi:GATA transcription factor 1-like [Lolium rigidum]|uniref:GATA transcription factor 1-like n=1 Tax=Lolium rigidum TaxID=89674 RepID=UPI001F5D63E0|nr:GATA transcription factor 1-like [Lolium rigidum]